MCFVLLFPSKALEKARKEMEGKLAASLDVQGDLRAALMVKDKVLDDRDKVGLAASVSCSHLSSRCARVILQRVFVSTYFRFVIFFCYYLLFSTSVIRRTRREAPGFSGRLSVESKQAKMGGYLYYPPACSLPLPRARCVMFL